MSISDPYVAFCFDEAVLMFGRHIEGAMDVAARGKTKPEQQNAARRQVLESYLNKPGDTKRHQVTQPTTGQFRDPALEH